MNTFTFCKSTPILTHRLRSYATCKRPRYRCTATPPVTVPANINEVVQTCASGLDRASAAGYKRMRVRALVPGLNPGLENNFPYNEKLLLMLVLSLARTASLTSKAERVNLRFKSAGTAASALKTYGEGEPLPANIHLAVYDDPNDTEGDVNIIINPVAARGNPVLAEIERALGRAPEATWILFNPDFSADRSALGMRDQTKRDEFLKQFVDAFFFRNLFEISRPKLIPIEKGALLRTAHDNPWIVFSLVNGEFVVAGEFENEPTPIQISNTAEKGIEKNLVAKKAVSAEVNYSDYLLVVMFCGIVFSGLYWALNEMPSLISLGQYF